MLINMLRASYHGRLLLVVAHGLITAFKLSLSDQRAGTASTLCTSPTAENNIRLVTSLHGGGTASPRLIRLMPQFHGDKTAGAEAVANAPPSGTSREARTLHEEEYDSRVNSERHSQLKRELTGSTFIPVTALCLL